MSFFVAFDGGLGYFPHSRPVTMANSLSENLIGFSAKKNHASYFFELSAVSKACIVLGGRSRVSGRRARETFRKVTA